MGLCGLCPCDRVLRVMVESILITTPLFTTWHVPVYYLARRVHSSTPVPQTLSVTIVRFKGLPSHDVCHGPCHDTQMTSPWKSLVTHTHNHTHTHTRTHTRTHTLSHVHAHARTHTRTHAFQIFIFLGVSKPWQCNILSVSTFPLPPVDRLIVSWQPINIKTLFGATVDRLIAV